MRIFVAENQSVATGDWAARIVIQHPWVIGIPAPESLLKKILADPSRYEDLMNDFDVVIVPKQK